MRWSFSAFYFIYAEDLRSEIVLVLVKAHFYDSTSICRLQDLFVVFSTRTYLLSAHSPPNKFKFFPLIWRRFCALQTTQTLSYSSCKLKYYINGFSEYGQILSVNSPQPFTYFPRIFRISRKNEKYAEIFFYF